MFIICVSLYNFLQSTKTVWFSLFQWLRRPGFSMCWFGCDLRELIIQRISWTQNLVVAFCCFFLFVVNRQSLHRKCLDDLPLQNVFLFFFFRFRQTERHQFFSIHRQHVANHKFRKKHILIYYCKNWEWTSLFIRFVFAFNFLTDIFFMAKNYYLDVLHLVNWCHTECEKQLNLHRFVRNRNVAKRIYRKVSE